MHHTRIVLAAAVLLVAGTAQAAEPPKLDAKMAEAKLKKLREATDKADVKAYTAREWEAVRLKEPDLKKAGEALDKLTDGLSAVESAAKKLADTIGKGADARGSEVKRFMAVIEDRKTTPNRVIEPLDKLRKDVDAVPAGVVGEDSDPKFKLTTDELVKDPKKAAERLKARLDAMQANANQLDENAKHLEAIAKRAKVSQESVEKAEKDADSFVRRGGIRDFAWDAIRKHFDAGKLTKQYKDVAEIADEKAKSLRKAVEAQKKQIEVYQGAVKVLAEYLKLD